MGRLGSSCLGSNGLTREGSQQTQPREQNGGFNLVEDTDPGRAPRFWGVYELGPGVLGVFVWGLIVVPPNMAGDGCYRYHFDVHVRYLMLLSLHVDPYIPTKQLHKSIA